MKLTVVVPVHDDAAGLARLLHSLDLALRGTDILTRVVVVDDGSPAPLDRALPQGALPNLPLTWRRNARPMGAGQARNIGLDEAESSHVLFLDADDTVTPELGTLLRQLQGLAFDFALFAHDDSRRLAQGETGPDEMLDRALWADLAPGPDPVALTQAQARRICRISNYPWNKVWRHDFLRQNAIRYTEIALHNDIEPHWAGFIEARQILCSDRRCVIHHVARGRDQLTNRRGAERLCVIRALEAVIARLLAPSAAAPERACCIGPFLEFTFRLLDWVDGLLDDPAASAELKSRARYLLRHLALNAPPKLAGAVEDAFATEPGLALRFLHWAGSKQGLAPASAQ